jgi:hypothetical protein
MGFANFNGRWGGVATKPVRAKPKTMMPAAAIDPMHMNVLSKPSLKKHRGRAEVPRSSVRGPPGATVEHRAAVTSVRRWPHSEPSASAVVHQGPQHRTAVLGERELVGGVLLD